MRRILAVAVAVLSTAAFAQSPTASDKDHADHHPPGASAPAPASKAAAKSPEERQALMGEHMKAMQSGMTMMGRMKGPKAEGGMAGGMTMSPETMGMRMDMMDREAARTPAAK